MKQVWNVFVLSWYICGIEQLLLIRAYEETIDFSTRGIGSITCGDNEVIRINNAVVFTDESYCSSSDCVLSENDFKSIEEQCNGTTTCTIEFPKNTSCLMRDRYFNFSYSCFESSNMLCTFEFSFCKWQPLLDGNQSWMIYSPHWSNISFPNLPDADHTTKSEYGHYIYMMKQKNHTNTILRSQQISFETEKCLVLRYKMDGASELIIYKDLANSVQFTIKKSGDNNDWEQTYLSLSNGESAQIVIKGIIGNIDNATIAIDDIDIQDWKCTDASSFISCNFEKGLQTCGFEKKPKDQKNLQWDIIDTGSADVGRPSFDHTNGHGSFIYTESLIHDASVRRLIIITFKKELKVRCMSLWYFIYGRNPGHLKIYTMVKIKEGLTSSKPVEHLSSIIDSQNNMWSQFQVNVMNTKQINLEYNFTGDSYGGIALDDISIAPVKCTDKKPFYHECVERKNVLHIQCPVKDVLIEAMTFDPHIPMSCKNTDDQIKSRLHEIFLQCNINNTAMCVFTPADLFSEDCPLSKHMRLKYSCIDQTFPGAETSVNQRTSTSSHADDNTDNVQSSSSPVIDNTDSVQSSSSPVIGIVVGVVLSLAALVILVIVIVYFRRYRYTEKKGHSIVANEDSHTDYTGHQNTAFSPEVNVTTQTDYCEIRTSKHNDQYHDITDTFSPSINTTNDDEYSEIANVVNSPNNPNASTNYQHQYITLDPNATGFDRSNQHINLHDESRNNNNSNVKTSFAGGDDYAILDPDDLNESKNHTPKVLQLSENYVVLDPNETGFNRKNNDTVCNYELATPFNPTEIEDPYDVSKDETYDLSSDSRHKENENNIYSHMVDNEYDTAGNQRKKEDNDGTYDHFFGQKSEDDYDISKPL